MRLGEGSGAAVARRFCAPPPHLHAGMATFAEAGVSNEMSDFTTVDLLRHGEPQGGQKFRGALMIRLSPLGWEQLRTTVGDYRDWQVIVSSPLIRCAAFRPGTGRAAGSTAGDRARLPRVEFRRLGRPHRAEVYAADPLAVAQFWRDPVAHPIPGGEPVMILTDGSARAWNALLERYRGRHVLLVAHGGTIRMVLRQVLEICRCGESLAVRGALCRDQPGAPASAIPTREPQLVFFNGRLGMIRAFALALQLLTRLADPVLRSHAPRPEQLGQSVLFFPVRRDFADRRTAGRAAFCAGANSIPECWRRCCWRSGCC
jgi:alpha-ribazole phosphatase